MKAIPEDSIDIMISSLSESSMKQYDGALKKWWTFCKLKQAEPYSDSISLILEFLSKEFKNGASHGTLNCVRSAISFLHDHEIGKNPKIKMFFRGISKQRPTKPKYDVTWDPKIVLEHVAKWSNDETTDMKNLTLKLVMLLALVTGQRVQTLSLIDIRDILEMDNRIEIKIPQKIKTSGRGRLQPNFILPYFTENRSICVASTLKYYIHRTENLRKDHFSLLISFKIGRQIWKTPDVEIEKKGSMLN